MADVIFEDNTIEVINAMDDAINAGLEEAAGEVESQTKRNQTRTKSSDTKNRWSHHVDEKSHVATIGNPLENAIWEEYGTGEYALGGKGRRGGYWVFVEGSPSKSSKGSKTYTLEEAKKVVAMMRADGLDAYYTKGKTPLRALWKAMTSKRKIVMELIADKLKGM